MGDGPIRTEQLRKVYGELVAVDGLDLEVRRGEFFGLLGPNGAGKSTTIGMLTTTVVPTGGRALVSGLDVSRHAADVKRQIGVVSQANTLDRALTVWENLYYHGRFFGVPRTRARARADELLEQFSLTERADSMVFQLSGGLAQRLMMARALAHEPEVLFLDEPTSGIDPQTRINLWRILQDLNRAGQTTLLTTHYMEEADVLCERVAIIDHGQALYDGLLSTLVRRFGTTRELAVDFTVDAPDALDIFGGLPVTLVHREGPRARFSFARDAVSAAELITRLAPFDFSIEQLDGAVHFGGSNWSGAVAEHLCAEEMIVVATPQLAAQCRTPADVLRLPLLQITSRAFSWRTWVAAIGLTDAAVTPYLQVETFAMGIEAVLAGLCVGILPGFFVMAEIATGSLAAIGPAVTSESAYYFVYPERKRDYYPLREFAGWMREEVTRGPYN